MSGEKVTALLQNRLLETLQELSKQDLTDFHIVMLPDFFVDHFVSLASVEETCTAIMNVTGQGGGNLPGFTQRITQGGNAANTALGLSRLGMSSHLICRTDALGMHLLEYFLGKNKVDLSGVKIDGSIALTTALEFQDHQANVMIGDAGSVGDFCFERLNNHDCDCIASADLVGVTNWNLNRYGTTLAQNVFAFAKKHNVRTFFDAGDPSPRKQDIPELLGLVVTSPHLDIFGCNENELRQFSNTSATTQQELIVAASLLKKKTTARIDLHTSLFSCSLGNEPIIVPTSSLASLYRVTGAGDAWNAANIYADLLEFADDERLMFANVFAGLYISSPQPVHPTIDMVINYIKKTI